jgi:Ni,Fe-hydrogenase III small subunit/ferredoxin
MPWVPHGISNGQLTTRWPRRPDDYFDAFPAAVRVTDPAQVTESAREAAAACPTSAIAVAVDGILLDRGRCILCARCAAIAPDSFALRGDAATAALSRETLVVGRTTENDNALRLLRQQLAARVKQLRRSVHIRHLDAGSDGSDEWEIQALLNPVYDMHRLGIFLTASPRHADILLVTGIGAQGMREPLLRTREGMPDPVVVIAVGADAASGGLVGRGYTGGTGIAPLVGVDVWVPGSPASPFSILHAILLALGRVPDPSKVGSAQ